jgi:hypothetical protein
VLSLSKHERLNSQRVGFFRSPFDKLRANGKIFISTALGHGGEGSLPPMNPAQESADAETGTMHLWL